MKTIALEQLEEHTAELIAEVDAGHRLTLIRGGRAIAEILPVSPAAETTHDFSEETWPDYRGKTLREVIGSGWNLGGLKITDRDEIYDRSRRDD